MAELSERKKKILTAVIEAYIASAEPVGSKRIAEEAGLNVSYSTIRNQQADLTSIGYLAHPHTR
ncbi:MAG: heat-inducible transcription repressor HrcA, partial [Oscillospiraceae bacterium]|nr:heat-inducible transcription repressor HrcA [Oscillospiraceae bacterium]